jgi:hypothetical protein
MPEIPFHRSILKLGAPAVVLAFVLTGVGPAATVRAAEPADKAIERVSVSLSEVPNPACAHTRYHVEVLTQVDRSANVQGNFVQLDGGLGPPDIHVTALSSDPSVAAFHPQELTASALEGRIGQGNHLLLKTEEAGSTTLTVRWATAYGGDTFDAELTQPLKVVPCRFKVTWTSIVLGSAPNVAQTIVTNGKGEIEGEPDGGLTGNADITWDAQASSKCFSHHQEVSPSKAGLHGSLDENGGSLTVTVRYDPTMLFEISRATCYTSGGSDVSAELEFPPLQITVPITGGSRSQPVSIHVGELDLNGTAIVNVQPIAE